jgi:hypothetical protein
MENPGFFALKSSMASLAASTEPWPVKSEMKLDMDVSTPTFTLT